MGYDIDRFVNISQDIAENFKCSVCLDIFEAPLELPCGHIYCFECIRTYFSSSCTSECPECRGEVQAQDVKPPNRKLLSLLHNLNIKCEFAGFGCSAVVKVECLIAHSRECRYNRSTEPTAPPQEDIQQNIENMIYLLGGDSNLIDRSERVQRLQTILQFFALALDQNEVDGSVASYNDEESADDDEFLIRGVTVGDQLQRLTVGLLTIILVILNLIFAFAPVAAIAISALKLHSCTEIETLPYALMALGISMFLSIVLEATRRFHCKDKFCIGLKIIQSFAIGSLINLAVAVYSNLDYNSKIPNHHNSTLTCDSLLFEFSFWFVSALLAVISIVGIISITYLIFNNLRTIWSEWPGSYVKLAFIYSIAIVGLIVSIATVTMGAIYFDSCAAIPSLTTKLVVFGSIGLVCWLIMLLSRHYLNCCIAPFAIGWLVSFICIAIDVHQYFPWQFTSHALRYTINCDQTIYIYSLVIVCINYISLGATASICIHRHLCLSLFR